MSIDFAALAAASDGFTAIIEIATGHRQKCETAGFSPTAAEHMAVHLHNTMITTALEPKTP
jgi:hypothetical protein